MVIQTFPQSLTRSSAPNFHERDTTERSIALVLR
jgi:hypothetical protein